MTKNYIPYHVHSDDSLLDSCTKFQDYIDLAVKNHQKAIASTEHGKPLSWVHKKILCDKAGIKFIHGVECYLTESLDEKVRDNYHTILLAKNYDGVLELNELISKSSDERHNYYVNRISFDEFLSISDNIISTSACLASPLNRLPESHPRFMELARKYTFFEIQLHNHPDQIQFNQRLYELSKEIGTPLIVGTDTHNSSQYKAECRSVLMESKGKVFGDEDSFDLSYKTYDELVEMSRVQGALPEEVYMKALENTNLLDDLCENFELDTSIKYPISYGSSQNDTEKLKELVSSKFEQKLKDGIIPAEQEQDFRVAIREEMQVFEKLQMCGFMLSMSELLSWCRDEGMAIGPARGSVGGSRVAFVADIIDLNPETWHTVFSRFCNEDRVEVGDIDIDCIESDRPRIFQHIIERFGADKTARVASFGTIQGAGVIDDVGRCLAKRFKKKHGEDVDNPYSLPRVKQIKKEFLQDEERTKKNYPELFYYFDGLIGTKVSQSVHPAGMIISPVNLAQQYGTFYKDGEICLMMDMDDAHDVSLVKYDFLVLKTVQVIRDTCNYIGIPFPKSHEMDWNDESVWDDMVKTNECLFQFESSFSGDCLKKFQPKNIFELTMVTACIRPSGASYRNDLLARKVHKNPSTIIDDLLKDNLGFLIYQEDTIKFLQQVCGLSGSEADIIRRAISKKQKDKLDAALPSILDGYCSKSDKPRAEAENEAKEFIQIIEDSAAYQFGYNHAVAYCLLSYLCAYFRYHYPLEFITSFLNNAANDEDINNGTVVAKKYGIQVSIPRFGFSGDDYTFNKEKKVIAKGVSSIRFMGKKTGSDLYRLSKNKRYDSFCDLLCDIKNKTSIDTRQVDNLIKIDFFKDFGNQRELIMLRDVCELFKYGNASQIKKEVASNTPFYSIIEAHSNGVTKSGSESKNFTYIDLPKIIRECEQCVLSLSLDDIDDIVKVHNFSDIMGYSGYVSGKEKDRPKLYVKSIYALKRKKDGVQFGYGIITQSIGSGIESRFTVFNPVFNTDPIKEGDLIRCLGYEKDGQYFKLTKYTHI